MRVAYIGQNSVGTTSHMRCKTLRQLMAAAIFEIIDTHQPFYQTPKFWRSLGFRWKRGPLINHTNSYVLEQLTQYEYDMIWVDKAVYLTPRTTALLKSKTKKLVHFTPDPAFTFHKSKHYFKSLPFYDVVITTKSYELEHYKKAIQATVLYATQGFDKALHKPSPNPFNHKKGLAFIGHHEMEREQILEQLLFENIPVTLAGIEWQAFAKKHHSNSLLHYLGSGVYGNDYVAALGQAKIAWGAISKWIPELHTTRTFEIPACGTALLTERNRETEQFFNEDEAIFYSNVDELIAQVKCYMQNDAALETLTQKGTAAVHEKGFDYESILLKLLKQIQY